MLAQEVEETVRASGNAEVDAHDVGLAILDPLRKLDQVAFLRFASVYRDFESLDDFADAIAELRVSTDERGARRCSRVCSAADLGRCAAMRRFRIRGGVAAITGYSVRRGTSW